MHGVRLWGYVGVHLTMLGVNVTGRLVRQEYRLLGRGVSGIGVKTTLKRFYVALKNVRGVIEGWMRMK